MVSTKYKEVLKIWDTIHIPGHIYVQGKML